MIQLERSEREQFFSSFPNTCTIKYKDGAFDYGTYHFHEQYEILLMLHSQAEFTIEDKTYQIGPRTLLLFNNKDLHKASSQCGQYPARYVLTFSPEYISAFSTPQTELLACFLYRPFPDSQILHLSEYEATVLEAEFRELDESKNKSLPYGSDLWQKLQLGRILILINNYYQRAHHIQPQTLKQEYRTIFSALLYIHEHLEQKLSVPDLSKRFFLSEKQFGMIFKQITGLTPQKYIIRCRIDEAKRLLCGRYSVDAVCTMVGFNDLSNFCRTFKNYVGMSPRQYAGSISVEASEHLG